MQKDLNTYPDQSSFMDTELAQRFWTEVKKTETCWLWTGDTQSEGRYGSFETHQGWVVRAHRFAYMMAHGLIPGGVYVLHKCDNGLCVRPDHLFLGTQKDNVRDAIQKGHFKILNPARLTRRQVRAIRAKAKHRTETALAKEYGVWPSTISDIVNGVTWKERN